MEMHVGEAGWRNGDFSESNSGKMHVFFHAVQVKQNFETVKQGRPIFVQKIFIKKLVPGDSLEIDRPMRDTDMDEFPVEWARYQQKKADHIPGTPIEAWPALNDTQKAEFRAMHIFTVDQFANLADSVGHKIMGFNDLRSKARSFVNAGKSEGDRAETDAKFAAQERELADLRALVNTMTSRKKPGRKAREEMST